VLEACRFPVIAAVQGEQPTAGGARGGCQKATCREALVHVSVTQQVSLCLPCVCFAGACVGAGVDLITAADLRYCSTDATFCVKVGLCLFD
jgi:enoyl-CoA hydratase/carnithine racemase